MFLRLLVISLCAGLIFTQQKYNGNLLLSCGNNDTATVNRLFSNYGRGNSCPGYLIFQSKKLYNSVQTISALLSVNASDLARVNDVKVADIFEIDKKVIVPVKCFSLAKYYQANTSYTIHDKESTYFIIAKETYQGLATCDGLRLANPYGELDLLVGMVLQVPMRCACPTAAQTALGVKYLLTYPVSWGDSVPDISNRFHITSEYLQEANELSDEKIFPFTTILIPLKDEPMSSWTIVQNKTEVGTLLPDDSKNKSKINRLYIGVGIAVGSSLAACLAFTCFSVLLIRKSGSDLDCRHGIENDGDTKRALPEEIRCEIASYDHQSFGIFKYEEVKCATDNFSLKNLIKGSVYRGEINGRSVTIKKMRMNLSMEVNILKKINHFNLTQLYGICVSQRCSYLILEYLENGCLQDWLKDENAKESSNWQLRIQIAMDVANGLQYLHNFIEPAYIHKDIASSNILLNKDLRAKIVNLNLAQTSDKGTKHVLSTENIVGTRGYMAPEYLSLGEVTTKLDVYAFGVVLLELATGKDALMVMNSVQNKEVSSLKEEVMTLFETGNLEAELTNLIDPRLKGNNTAMAFSVRVMKLSVACMNNDPVSRPCIDEVVSVLQMLQADMEKYQVHMHQADH